MAWALQFDGVNDVAGFAEWTAPDDFLLSGEFTPQEAGDSIFLGSPVGNSWIGIYGGGFKAKVVGVTIGNINLPDYAATYSYTLERTSGVVTLSVDGVGNVTKNAAGDFTLSNFGAYNSFGSVPYKGRLVGVTEFISASSSRRYDIDDSSHAAGTPILTDTIGGNDATGVNMPTDGSAWVDLGGGGVTVTGATPSFNHSSIAASIDLTGSIDITGQTANYTYSVVNGAVDLTGDISITGATASYNYQSINGVVDLTGEITVLGLTPNQLYSSVNGIIELGAVISVVGLTPNYSYQGIIGEVSLNGEILVSGETPSYSYSAIKGFVTTGEAQVIGTVTSSFASDVYSSGFKPNTITVNFKS